MGSSHCFGLIMWFVVGLVGGFVVVQYFDGRYRFCERIASWLHDRPHGGEDVR